MHSHRRWLLTDPSAGTTVPTAAPTNAPTHPVGGPVHYTYGQVFQILTAAAMVVVLVGFTGAYWMHRDRIAIQKRNPGLVVMSCVAGFIVVLALMPPCPNFDAYACPEWLDRLRFAACFPAIAVLFLPQIIRLVWLKQKLQANNEKLKGYHQREQHRASSASIDRLHLPVSPTPAGGAAGLSDFGHHRGVDTDPPRPGLLHSSKSTLEPISEDANSADGSEERTTPSLSVELRESMVSDSSIAPPMMSKWSFKAVRAQAGARRAAKDSPNSAAKRLATANMRRLTFSEGQEHLLTAGQGRSLSMGDRIETWMLRHKYTSIAIGFGTSLLIGLFPLVSPNEYSSGMHWSGYLLYGEFTVLQIISMLFAFLLFFRRFCSCIGGRVPNYDSGMLVDAFKILQELLLFIGCNIVALLISIVAITAGSLTQDKLDMDPVVRWWWLICLRMCIIAGALAFTAMPLWITRRQHGKRHELQLQSVQGMLQSDDATQKATAAVVDFDKLMTLYEGVEFFTKFLVREFCVENVLFWRDGMHYKAICSLSFGAEHDRAEYYRRMWAEYIAEGSPSQVNVSDANRLKIEQSIHASVQDVAALDECLHEIFELMRIDPFPRFKRSNLAEDLKEKLMKSGKYLPYEHIQSCKDHSSRGLSR